MAAGFGFSVGDLIAGIRVFKESIEAFSNTKGASADFITLVNEISTLQDGLEAIEELQLVQNFPRGRPQPSSALYLPATRASINFSDQSQSINLTSDLKRLDGGRITGKFNGHCAKKRM